MSLPRPVLIDMPWHIKQKIVKNTDNITRLVLRKTNKVFREQVDCSPYPSHFENVLFRVFKKYVNVSFFYGDRIFMVEYRKADFHCVKKWSDNLRIVWGKFDHIEQAVSDVATIFANRRASVTNFIVSSTEYVNRSVKRSLKTFPKEKASFLSAFQEKFSRLPELAQIENAYLEWALNENEMMQVIPFLRAKSLKMLEVNPTEENTMENVLATDQFRNLESFYVENGNDVFGSFVNLHNSTVKLPRSVNISDATATTAELSILLAKLLRNTEEFDNFNLQNIDYNKTLFLNYIINLHRLNPDEAEQHVIKMHNSDGYLLITFIDYDLSFEKIDQELGLRLLRGEVDE